MTEQEALYILENSENISDVQVALKVAIKALEEIQQYRAIGTVEECRAVMEKQMPQKPVEFEDKYYGCPTCDNMLMYKWVKYPKELMPKMDGLPYCLGCGQRIDWE